MGSTSKDSHIQALLFKRWAVAEAPTFTPHRHSCQATYIDHLTTWDPRQLAHQGEDTLTLPTTFLDHNEVLGNIHLPILTAEASAPPDATTPRAPRYIIQSRNTSKMNPSRRIP